MTTPAPDPRLVPTPTFGVSKGNADYDLTPSPSPGRGAVEFDFPGVEVGTAEYTEGPTGATVVHVPAGARTSIDDRGGAIGIVGRYEYNHAICLAGGSVYGLGAAAGVSAELLGREQNQVDWQHLRTVSGAIIYDFSARDNAISPDAALGRAALEWARPGEFPVGRCGAGIAASAGKVDYGRAEFTGQGAAFRQVGRAKVLVATVTNPVGVIVDRDGRVVRGNYDPDTGQRSHPVADFAAAFDAEESPRIQRGNTTLTVVVTNVAMADRELSQFGKQVHSSMHRAIQPFHSSLDGDTLFALTTDEVDVASATGEAELSCVGLGAIASEVAWDAVLSSVA
ncbi:P1 family peptidase [Solicola gregarius]|uniref:P1 family peptidase n=1 Tax=Solicola gregarius TaxID=2908642 RepID=A0AA46TKI4_9ACTN|nr:P1 family peptidase [Solicola gregarius]UYM06589.1 P1 family peptidase [Solicola gregarius]